MVCIALFAGKPFSHIFVHYNTIQLEYATVNRILFMDKRNVSLPARGKNLTKLNVEKQIPSIGGKPNDDYKVVLAVLPVPAAPSPCAAQ